MSEEDYFSTCELSNPNNPELLLTTNTENESNLKNSTSSETVLKSHFQIIGDIENKLDIGNFDFLPDKWYGLDTRNFGTTVKNNFLELKKIATDINIPYKDRFQTIRYLQRIPRFDKYLHINQCMESILLDFGIDFNEKYFFFSNNERLIKLDYEILNHCHLFVVNNFTKLNASLIYKIISCQYILGHIPTEQYDSESLQLFLYTTSKDKDMGINYRSECADILWRLGYNKWRNFGQECILELGQLYTQNKATTIYTNAENVHDLSINEAIISTLKYLITNTYVTVNSGQIYETLSEAIKLHSQKEKILTSFQRMILDGAKYEGRNMLDIMLIVWENIINHQHKDLLIQRFIQELIDMDNTCSSGHLSRLINTLNGFIDIPIITISYNQQLRSNIFARLHRNIKLLSVDQQSTITHQITEDNKTLIYEFLDRFSPREELYEEFVVSKLITESDFDECYQTCITEYFGLND
jgi:hypothetical protein